MFKALKTVGRYIILMGRVFARPERMRMFFRQYVNELEQLGVNSIGIVLLISFFIGAVITIQIKLNIESPFMPRWTVGYVTREIMLPSSVIASLGNKQAAKNTMANAGVPIIPGGKNPIYTVEEGMKEAETIGYPVIIKAALGGGGKGMRVADTLADFEESFRTAQKETQMAFQTSHTTDNDSINESTSHRD